MKSKDLHRLSAIVSLVSGVCIVALAASASPAGKSGAILVVNQLHAAAEDANAGTESLPLRTVNAAAQRARPGDTVLVHAGVYRERVSPARGGEAGRPIVYVAAEGEAVYLRGSEEFRPQWIPVPKTPGVFAGSLGSIAFGAAAYHGYCDSVFYADFNPYLRNFDRNRTVRPQQAIIDSMQSRVTEARERIARGDTAAAPGRRRGRGGRWIARFEKEIARLASGDDPYYGTSLGQVFIDGLPLLEVERRGELRALSGTWMTSPGGDSILVHPPASTRTLAQRMVEISVRHAVFSPLKRGLGYIHVRGFIIEHGANQSPTWWETGWPQSGLLSTRTGHHWVIENNVVRYAKSVGIDCGSEHIDSKNIEFAGGLGDPSGRIWNDYTGGKPIPADYPGRHLIRNNRICDNGHCGLAGIGHYQTKVIGNIIERNNRTGYTSPWWEFGGIKFHCCVEARIEGNLIRDNDAHGIWLDNRWRGTRVTRNVIVNNLWSGINMELGRGPMLIDNNVIAYTRQGDGIYGHDVADITIAHNLLYANANFGVWVAYATDRVQPEDGCWDIKTYNNMIMGNRVGAIGYPLPWECAGNNRSDGNLLMGGGEALDEGSGPQRPQFQLTHKTHGSASAKVKVPMTKERARALFVENLDRANVPAARRPNLDLWEENYLVGLDVWRAVMGNDTASRETSVIRDGLQSRLVSWECDIDSAVRDVKCIAVKGVDRDYLGNPVLAKSPMPGPFQKLEVGAKNHIVLWPVRGIGSSWLLE